MNSALIGSTGFIGGNLKKQLTFSGLYNSKNIDEISGNQWDHIVCTGLPGVKWYANKFPEEDLKKIDLLKNNLSKTVSKRFTLISTIDVYSDPHEVDEDREPDNNTPYGKNRLEFENFVLEKFQDVRILRLPIVFGPGFKKNYLYDMINKNNLDRICIDSAVQFYYVLDLIDDIESSWSSNPVVKNMATEPLFIENIVNIFFPELKNMFIGKNAFTTNMKTKYSDTGYLYSSSDMIDKIGTFLDETFDI